MRNDKNYYKLKEFGSNSRYKILILVEFSCIFILVLTSLQYINFWY